MLQGHHTDELMKKEFEDFNKNCNHITTTSNINIDNSILDRAIEMWGQKAQIKMAAEECLELALEIGKYFDRDSSADRWTKVIDEMADVTIMTRQMERLDPSLVKAIQERVNFKMERLNQRLNKKQF